MKRVFSTYLLMMVFAITVIPFNAFHHHDEDEHIAAHHSHEKNHSCALDHQFCKAEVLSESCEHESHVQTALPKCFSCTFHFIKQYTIQDEGHAVLLPQFKVTFGSYCLSDSDQILVWISNKGPPVQRLS
jgi:hypothetical protein